LLEGRIVGAEARDGETGVKHQSEGTFRMSDELLEVLRQRVAASYYDQPHVIDMIARAILHSRGLYPG